MAALAEQEGGPVAADGRLSGVEDGVEVAVDPVVVARHRHRRRGDPGEIGGTEWKSGGEAEGGRRKRRWRNSLVKNILKALEFLYILPKKKERCPHNGLDRQQENGMVAW
jgi:hypothetical protein